MVIENHVTLPSLQTKLTLMVVVPSNLKNEQATLMLCDFLAFSESHTSSVLHPDCISMVIGECEDKIVTSKVMVHEKVSRTYLLIDLRREMS